MILFTSRLVNIFFLSLLFNNQIFQTVTKVSVQLFLLFFFLVNNLSAQTQIAKLTASDGAAEDFFGHSVSVCENFAIVGAHFEDTNGWGAGAAYIFRRVDGNWNEQQKIIGSDINAYDFFATSVDIAENVAVVGAPFDRAVGTVYVFRWNGSNWMEESILQASDGLSNELFGQSVAINRSADLIVVGAPMDGLGRGSAYIFTFDGSTWVEQQNIFANDGLAFDKFGFSVSISENGKMIMVGEVGPESSGKAHVFVKDGDTWVRVSKLIPTGGTSGDGFGASVSISDSFAVVGSRFDAVGFIDSGSAHIFEKQGNTWHWQSKIYVDDRHENQRFGYVSMNSNLILAGATHDNQNGLESGAAYIFKLNGNIWTQTAKIVADDGFAGDWFGSSVKISGSRAIIGSPYDNDNGTNSGSAYLFDLQNLTNLDDVINNCNREFRLHQNYPNPFNPATNISYELPQASHITIHVYNAVGQRVAQLVNQDMSSGRHNVMFNAGNLSSGMYIYRLEAGDFVQIRKMILIR